MKIAILNKLDEKFNINGKHIKFLDIKKQNDILTNYLIKYIEVIFEDSTNIDIFDEYINIYHTSDMIRYFIDRLYFEDFCIDNNYLYVFDNDEEKYIFLRKEKLKLLLNESC